MRAPAPGAAPVREVKMLEGRRMAVEASQVVVVDAAHPVTSVGAKVPPFARAVPGDDRTRAAVNMLPGVAHSTGIMAEAARGRRHEKPATGPVTG